MQDDGNDYGVFSYKDPDSFRVFDVKTGLKLPMCTKEDFCLYYFPPKISHRQELQISTYVFSLIYNILR